MAEKKETIPAQDSKYIEVELIGEHTHQGKPYQKGERITINKRQLEKLREWGKVK